MLNLSEFQYCLYFWFNFLNVFSIFQNYLPLEKGGALHLNKLEFPSTKDALCQFGWNWTSGSEDEDENGISLWQLQRRQTSFDQKSSLEPLAQVSWKPFNILYTCISLSLSRYHTINQEHTMRVFERQFECMDTYVWFSSWTMVILMN